MNQSQTRIENAEETILLANHSKVIPTHSVVNSEPVGVAEAVLEVEGVVVLVSVPVRITDGLAAAIDGASKKITQGVEGQLASVIRIEVFVHRSPAIFIAILIVMLPAVV